MSVSISGSGQVPVQVVSATKTDTFSTTSTSFTDITGLSASITPSSSSSKILVTVVLGATTSDNDVAATLLLRGSTAIAVGDGANGVLGQIYHGGGSSGEHWYGHVPTVMTFLDSPATTSATTYKVQMRVNAGTGYLNRTTADGSQYAGRTVSTITLMEISQ